MDNSSYKVIAVDDEIWALRGLCNIVNWEDVGFSIIGSYTSSAQALENIVSLKPDVVFTDIRMPGIDGMDLIEAIRNSGVHARIVIVSAYRDFDVAKKAISKDVTDYLMKPLDKKEVAELLSRLRLSLDREHSEKGFVIRHYDLSQITNRNNPEVMRYLEQSGKSGLCRVVFSERDLTDEPCFSEMLTEIYVKGFRYSYLCDGIADIAVFEEYLRHHVDAKLGVSRCETSFSEFESMLEAASDSFEGCFLYSDNRKISEIQEYLCRHFSEKLSLPEIAEHFFVSESYLYELFRKNTDTSVVGFIKNIRLNRAAALLCAGGHTVSEIADTVGYPDVGYFGKLFKSKFGCTPEQYATEHINSQN